MGKPAITIQGAHLCPQSDGNKPHGVSQILPNKPSVFIGKIPIAKEGDKMQCASSPKPNSIKKGSTSVFINGKGIARSGDPTDHNGMLTGGSTTVLIG